MFIEFKCYKNYFYILVYWILELFVSIVKNLIHVTEIFESKLNEELKNDLLNEYLQLVILVISDLLAGFLVLYTKFSLRTHSKIKKEQKEKYY